MDYYKLFAQRLNDAMELRDISAAEIARQSNISEPMISRYRSGQYIPRMKALDRLAEVLTDALSRMPAPRLVYDEFRTFEKNVATFDEFANI